MQWATATSFLSTALDLRERTSGQELTLQMVRDLDHMADVQIQQGLNGAALATLQQSVRLKGCMQVSGAQTPLTEGSHMVVRWHISHVGCGGDRPPD